MAIVPAPLARLPPVARTDPLPSDRALPSSIVPAVIVQFDESVVFAPSTRKLAPPVLVIGADPTIRSAVAGVPKLDVPDDSNVAPLAPT